MSAANKPTVVPAPEPEPEQPVLLKSFGVMNLYWAESINSLRIIEASGVNIYYVIGNEKLTEVVNNVTKINLQPNIFRVEKSLVGRAIVQADTKELKMFSQIERGATYDLPKMPYEFVQRNDAFFRKADLVHGTEAVLLLTYDPAYLGTENAGDGWGILVPDQENTAAHCKYEPDSVMEHKPEHVQIVGTWHSHPQMSAFFSGTDHADQDDWDGVHITSGWKGKGPMEYHIALVMAGKNWGCQPDLVFEPAPLPEVPLDGIDEMVGKVKKKAIPTTSYTPSHSGVTPGTPNVHSPWTGHTNINRPGLLRAVKLPVNAPKPTDVTIVASVEASAVNYKCPFCKTPLTEQVWNAQRCIACQSFLLMPGITLAELTEERRTLGKHYIMDIDPAAAGKPIVIWTPAIKDTDEDLFSDDMRTASLETADSPK